MILLHFKCLHYTLQNNSVADDANMDHFFAKKDRFIFCKKYDSIILCEKLTHTGDIYKTFVLYILKLGTWVNFRGGFNFYGCFFGRDTLIAKLLCRRAC